MRKQKPFPCTLFSTKFWSLKYVSKSCHLCCIIGAEKLKEVEVYELHNVTCELHGVPDGFIDELHGFLCKLDTLMLPVPWVAQTFTWVGHYKIRLLPRVGLNFTQVTHFLLLFHELHSVFHELHSVICNSFLMYSFE